MENRLQGISSRGNSNSPIRLALIFAVAIFLASFVPGPLVLATLSGLLNSAAIVIGVLAALARQPLWADRMTGWDEAALLLAASLVAGMFVDPAAIEELAAAGASPATEPVAA